MDSQVLQFSKWISMFEVEEGNTTVAYDREFNPLGRSYIYAHYYFSLIHIQAACTNTNANKTELH